MKFRKTALALAAFTAAFSLFIASGTFSSSANASSVRGDVNGDGKVNILDLISLKNILLGIENGEETTCSTVEETASTTVEETIEFEETKYDVPVTETPESADFENMLLDYNTVFISKNQYPDTDKIPARSQLIKNKEEYKTYLDELNIPEELSEEILSDTADYNEYYSAIFTVDYENKNTFDPNVTLNKDEIIFSNSFKNILYDKRDSGKCLLEARIPKKYYIGQELTIETEVIVAVNDYVYKPVIYLYPEETTDINVKLSIDGDLKYTYPEYPENGWNVTASPDSVLHDASGREYSYLFWEGSSDCSWDMSKGFVVKGSDTVSFLQEKLEYLGLTPKEYNDFIVFWLPKMQDNEYNLISFQTDLYEDYAKLDITPEPDCIQRVFMAFKPLDKYEEVPEQELEPFTRHGYSVIEWGGTEVSEHFESMIE